MPEIGTKRTNYEFEEDNMEKKSRQEGEEKIRLLVLGHYAGPLIGTGGENFKRLRETYNVKITGLKSRANERIVQLDGPRADCLKIVQEILPLCPVARYDSWSSKSPFEVNLLANSGDLGMIIGKGGSKLREIAVQTDAHLKVYPECLPNSNERVIALGGETEEAIVKGIETILGIMDTAPKRSSTIYYNPEQLDGHLGELQGHSNLSSITNSGTTTRQLENIKSVLENTNFASFLVSQRNLKEQNGFDPSTDFGSIQTVTTLNPSNEICGAIIGKGGQNIRYVKQVSGAQIDMTKSDSNNERKITLTGTQDQIQIAEQLMAQCINSSTLGGQQPHPEHQPQYQSQQQRSNNGAIHQLQQQMHQQGSMYPQNIPSSILMQTWQMSSNH